MAITKAQLLSRIRDEIGDPKRITGTASSGTTTTLVSSLLNQADNQWKGMMLDIETTTDGLAPQGENGKKIQASSQSSTNVTVELPFSAAIESGDTFAISVFSDSRITDVASDALLSFSEFRPLEFTESYNTVVGQKRIAPTSATAAGFWPVKIEKFDASSQTHIVYDRSDWFWDRTLKTVEWAWFWSQVEALTVFGIKHHTMPTSSGDNLTILDEDIGNFVQYASIYLLMSMSRREWLDNFGRLKPKSITRGQVKIDYGDSVTSIKANLQEELDAIKKKYNVPLSLNVEGVPAAARIDKRWDPDGTPMPQTFWKLL